MYANFVLLFVIVLNICTGMKCELVEWSGIELALRDCGFKPW